MVYKSGQFFLPFCHNPRVWRTDGQTDRILITRPRLHSMQRGKKQNNSGIDCCCYCKTKNIYTLLGTMATPVSHTWKDQYSSHGLSWQTKSSLQA